jgi:hypothetical protein
MNELLDAVKQLSAQEQWNFAIQILRHLEQKESQSLTQNEWHQFLQETYGSLRDTPIERWDQGEYDVRETLG